MAQLTTSDEKNASGFDHPVMTRDEKTARTGDGEVDSTANERQMWTGGEKTAFTADQGRSGREKANLVDEEVARRLQDEWNHQSSPPSSPTFNSSEKATNVGANEKRQQQSTPYDPPSGPPPSASTRLSQVPIHSKSTGPHRPHTNAVIDAGKLRAINEASPSSVADNLSHILNRHSKKCRIGCSNCNTVIASTTRRSNRNTNRIIHVVVRSINTREQSGLEPTHKTVGTPQCCIPVSNHPAVPTASLIWSQGKRPTTATDITILPVCSPVTLTNTVPSLHTAPFRNLGVPKYPAQNTTRYGSVKRSLSTTPSIETRRPRLMPKNRTLTSGTNNHWIQLCRE